MKIFRSKERARWDPWSLLITAEHERKIRFGTCSFNAVSHVRFIIENSISVVELEVSEIRTTSNLTGLASWLALSYFNFSLTSLA